MYRPDLSPAMGSTLVENRETVTELFDDHYIDVGTFRTRFWKAGNSGSTVVLLAGIGCTVLEWQKNIAALASRHRVYAFDMLGHGLTDKPQKDCYAIAELARFTLNFLTAQGEESAHFVGSSLGGRIALECARLARSRVKSMVLVAPAGVGRQTALTTRLATMPVLGELMTRPSHMGMRMLWRLFTILHSLRTALSKQNMRLQLRRAPSRQCFGRCEALSRSRDFGSHRSRRFRR